MQKRSEKNTKLTTLLTVSALASNQTRTNEQKQLKSNEKKNKNIEHSIL